MGTSRLSQVITLQPCERSDQARQRGPGTGPFHCTVHLIRDHKERTSFEGNPRPKLKPSDAHKRRYLWGVVINCVILNKDWGLEPDSDRVNLIVRQLLVLVGIS